MKDMPELTNEQFIQLATLAKALKDAGFFSEQKNEQQPPHQGKRIQNPEDIHKPSNTKTSRPKESINIHESIYTKDFVLDEPVCDIHETETYSINLSRQTHTYSGRNYIVLTKFRDGEAFRKFTIPIGLAHSIAFFLEQVHKKHGHKSPRPVHIDDYLEPSTPIPMLY